MLFEIGNKFSCIFLKDQEREKICGKRKQNETEQDIGCDVKKIMENITTYIDILEQKMDRPLFTGRAIAIPVSGGLSIFFVYCEFRDILEDIQNEFLNSPIVFNINGKFFSAGDIVRLEKKRELDKTVVQDAAEQLTIYTDTKMKMAIFMKQLVEGTIPEINVMDEDDKDVQDVKDFDDYEYDYDPREEVTNVWVDHPEIYDGEFNIEGTLEELIKWAQIHRCSFHRKDNGKLLKKRNGKYVLRVKMNISSMSEEWITALAVRAYDYAELSNDPVGELMISEGAIEALINIGENYD